MYGTFLPENLLWFDIHMYRYKICDVFVISVMSTNYEEMSEKYKRLSLSILNKKDLCWHQTLCNEYSNL